MSFLFLFCQFFHDALSYEITVNKLQKLNINAKKVPWNHLDNSMALFYIVQKLIR